MKAAREKDSLCILLIRNQGGQRAVRWHIESAKGGDCQPVTLYLAKLSFKIREIKLCQDKQ